MAELVTDRRLRTVRDDEVVARDAVLAEDAADLGLEALGGERLAVDLHLAVRRLRAEDHVARCAHRCLSRLL